MELDLSILEAQENTTTTMADMYGYAVFSRSFEENMRREQAREKEQRENYLQNVFLNEGEDEVGVAFERVFATQSTAIVREEFAVERNTGTNSIVLASFGLIGALLAGVIWIVIDKVRKGKKIRESNANAH